MRWFLGIFVVVVLALYFAFSGSVDVAPDRPPEAGHAEPMEESVGSEDVYPCDGCNIRGNEK